MCFILWLQSICDLIYARQPFFSCFYLCFPEIPWSKWVFSPFSKKKKSSGQISFLQRFSLYICCPFSFTPPPNLSHPNIHWAHLFFKLLLPKYSPSHYVYCAKIGKLHLAGLTILIEVPKYALFYYWTSLHTKRPDLNVFSPTGKKLFFLKY